MLLQWVYKVLVVAWAVVVIGVGVIWSMAALKDGGLRTMVWSWWRAFQLHQLSLILLYLLLYVLLVVLDVNELIAHFAHNHSAPVDCRCGAWRWKYRLLLLDWELLLRNLFFKWGITHLRPWGTALLIYLSECHLLLGRYGQVIDGSSLLLYGLHVLLDRKLISRCHLLDVKDTALIMIKLEVGCVIRIVTQTRECWSLLRLMMLRLLSVRWFAAYRNHRWGARLMRTMLGSTCFQLVLCVAPR